MSSRMTMAVSVSRSIHERCVASWKRQHVSCSMCNNTLWQRDTISLPLLHCVWFRDERARSIYICAKCFRHKKPKKKKKGQESYWCHRLCVSVPAQTASHIIPRKKVFDDFSCDVCRSQSLFVVRPLTVSRKNGPSWCGDEKPSFVKEKKKFSSV